MERRDCFCKHAPTLSDDPNPIIDEEKNGEIKIAFSHMFCFKCFYANTFGDFINIFMCENYLWSWKAFRAQIYFLSNGAFMLRMAINPDNN
jgi:hypothetical protein